MASPEIIGKGGLDVRPLTTIPKEIIPRLPARCFFRLSSHLTASRGAARPGTSHPAGSLVG
jgi:hypothetical protein